MSRYSASLEAGTTSKNVRSFVKEHHDELIKLIKTVAPYIIALMLLSAFIGHKVMEDVYESIAEKREQAPVETPADQTEAPPANTPDVSPTTLNEYIIDNTLDPLNIALFGINIAIAYLFAVIAISWHRLVLLGKDQYKPMKIFAPQKHEIDFLIALAVISFVIPFAFNILVLGIVAKAPILGLLALPASIFLIYCYFKVSFYFPAKAVNSPITLKTSFYLTKGYIWKMIAAGFFASWRIALALIGIMFVLMSVFGISAAATAENSKEFLSTGVILQQLLNLPILLYIQPLLAVIGVTVLSNYYQHALQNKAPQ